jgi:hypothetical protein
MNDLTVALPDGREVRVAFCIATWSGARLIETVHSLPQGARLLIVDTSQHAWPLAKAWNYGLNRLLVSEGYDVAIFPNDDVVLRPDTVYNLVTALLHDQYTRKVKPELLITTGRNVRPQPGAAFDLQRLKAAKPEFSPGPDFSLWCTTKKLIDTVGYFDEQFVPAYYEDNDMHRRIFLAGFEGAAVTPYWHYGSTTIETDMERRIEIQTNGRFAENQQKYIRKWGGLPHEERFAMPYNQPTAGYMSTVTP